MNAAGRWIGYALLLTAAALYVFSPYRFGIVIGQSMAPSYHSGSFYVMDRTPAALKSVNRGDVVVFKRNGISYIKRVLGVPGDRFYVNARTNDDQVDNLVRSFDLEPMQRLASKPIWRNAVKLVKRTVPAGSVYVVGDDATHSDDSRSFGPVPLDTLTGKVLGAPTPQREFSHLARVEQQSPA